MLTVSKSTTQALHALTGESRSDAALMLVRQDAHSYRLAQVAAELRTLDVKYGMTLEEYCERWETEDRDEDHGWDSEQDFMTWEALATQKRRLEGMSS